MANNTQPQKASTMDATQRFVSVMLVSAGVLAVIAFFTANFL
jgi:hypothetical protein